MLLPLLRHAIHRSHLLRRGDKVLIGVSGGPDSVTLLYLLCALKKEFHLTLHIAHVNHCLRQGALRDARRVQQLGETLGIPCAIARIPVRELAKRASLEETARICRLRFFAQTARRFRCTKVALAHTQDDQAETVLMRLIRGTGLCGLAAMLPQRTIGGIQIIRPLLGISRSQIVSYLRRRRIRVCIDETNADEAYLRNRIRRHLLPLLARRYNPRIKESLSNLAETAAADYEYLNQQATAASTRAGRRIRLSYLCRLHPALKRAVLRQALAACKGDTRRITFSHLRELEDLIWHRPVHSIVDLPCGIVAQKSKNYLEFSLRKPRRRSQSSRDRII